MYCNVQMNTCKPVRCLTEVVRRKYLTLATERTYSPSLRRYCEFLEGLPLQLPSEHKLERFLSVLSQEYVATTAQNQAINAIIPVRSAIPPLESHQFQPHGNRQLLLSGVGAEKLLCFQNPSRRAVKHVQ